MLLPGFPWASVSLFSLILQKTWKQEHSPEVKCWAIEAIKTLWLLRRPLQTMCHKQRRKMEMWRLCSVERCWRHGTELVGKCLEGRGAYFSSTKEMLLWLPSWDFCSRAEENCFNIYKCFGRNVSFLLQGSENCYLVWKNRENCV